MVLATVRFAPPTKKSHSRASHRPRRTRSMARQPDGKVSFPLDRRSGELSVRRVRTGSLSPFGREKTDMFSRLARLRTHRFRQPAHGLQHRNDLELESEDQGVEIQVVHVFTDATAEELPESASSQARKGLSLHRIVSKRRPCRTSLLPTTRMVAFSSRTQVRTAKATTSRNCQRSLRRADPWPTDHGRRQSLLPLHAVAGPARGNRPLEGLFEHDSRVPSRRPPSG